MLQETVNKKSRDKKPVPSMSGAVYRAVSYTHLDVYKRQVLQGGNLHRFNIAGIPQVCKNGVGKPDCLDIADHFLSKVVIDAVNMLRAKECLQLCVKGCGRCQLDRKSVV